MGVKVTNNGFGTLSAGINSSATTVTVDSGQGARFPTLGSGDFFFATLVDTSNNLEIIKVTARSTDSMTVTRAQDNTSARAFSIGDRIELRPTAALFEAIKDEGEVVNDTTPQLGGNLDLNSNNVNDGTLLIDSSRIRFPNATSNPGSPNTGDAYYNSSEKVVKHWNGSQWIQMSNTFSASGGTESTATIGGVAYKVHTFTSSGTFVVQSGSASVEYLVVAGGGSGGIQHSGGGGAGGFRTSVTGATSGGGGSAESAPTIISGSYTVTIGAGGAKNTVLGNGNGTRGNNGGNSTVAFTSAITSTGGGRGGRYSNISGDAGGSGGGAGTDSSSGGAGTANQGFAGGSASSHGSSGGGGGGGGGAGAVGANASGGTGDGGVGVSSSIDGTAYHYAGGGGGARVVNTGLNGSRSGNGGNGGGGGAGDGSDSSASGGTGGAGRNAGGNGLPASGNGSPAGASPGGNGGANTGGGGGSSGRFDSLAGNGGSGIVILRYQI